MGDAQAATFAVYPAQTAPSYDSLVIRVTSDHHVCDRCFLLVRSMRNCRLVATQLVNSGKSGFRRAARKFAFVHLLVLLQMGTAVESLAGSILSFVYFRRLAARDSPCGPCSVGRT
jgi:hypothetical protein